MFKKLTITMSSIFIMLIIATLCLILFSGSAHGNTTGDTYIIKAHDGKVAVFKENSEEPYLNFDVYISTLPEYDQNELQTGIVCDSTEELNKRIEDYIS